MFGVLGYSTVVLSWLCLVLWQGLLYCLLGMRGRFAAFDRMCLAAPRPFASWPSMLVSLSLALRASMYFALFCAVLCRCDDPPLGRWINYLFGMHLILGCPPCWGWLCYIFRLVGIGFSYCRLQFVVDVLWPAYFMCGMLVFISVMLWPSCGLYSISYS